MKYLDLSTVVNAYINFQNTMTNKSWGYLALIRGCKSEIKPCVPFEVDLDSVSNFLETIFNLSSIKKTYNSTKSWYVVFSNQWSDYFSTQGKNIANIYDIAIWSYRRKVFDDNVTVEDILSQFINEFNLPVEVINSKFLINSKGISFSNTIYDENALKNELSKQGVNVSTENIDAKKSSVVAAPGELSRGPFIQTLYAGLEISDYILIMQSNYFNLYSFDCQNNNSPSSVKVPLQQIFYGAPGTGKSYKVKSEILAGVPEENIFRTTFHPDYDYASFVGCYKPKAKGFNMLAGENLTEEQLLQKFSDSANGDDKKAKYLYEALIRQADMRHLGIDKNSLSSKLKDKGFSNCTYVPECDAMGKIYDYLVEDGYVVENKITYSFIPQVFTKAYIKAWEIIAKDEKVTVKVKKEDGTETEQEIFKSVYLVIEEINRGNCAQIFGDIFQLLDRNENGYSEYPIDIDEDLKNYLVQQLGADSEGIKGGKLCLPPNLNLLATMNTSDQSLFPMDSAFKRRWDWEYVPITNAFKKKDDGKYELDASNNKIPLGWKLFDENGQDWWEFIRKVNAIIASMTNSADKQLGYFFCKANDKGVISYNTFVNKVCFYLWNDVFRDYGFEDKDLFQYKETTDGKEETKDLTFPDFFDDSEEDGICKSLVNDFIQKVLDWKGGKGESDN